MSPLQLSEVKNKPNSHLSENTSEPQSEETWRVSKAVLLHRSWCNFRLLPKTSEALAWGCLTPLHMLFLQGSFTLPAALPRSGTKQSDAPARKSLQWCFLLGKFALPYTIRVIQRVLHMDHRSHLCLTYWVTCSVCTMTVMKSQRHPGNKAWCPRKASITWKIESSVVV